MKYLSKLLSMLLVGAMLYSTGCTDYASDIADLNREIQQIKTELVDGQINPLKAALEDTKADLEAAKADIQNLITKHDGDIARLEAVDAAINDKIDAANESILALQGELAEEVAALEAEIEALEDALENARAEAENADAALKAELLAEITDLETELLAKISELQSKLEGDIAALRTDMENKVKAATDAIAEANEEIAALDIRVGSVEADVETINEEIDSLETMLAVARGELEAADEKLAEDLAAAQAALAQAIADGDNALKTQLETAIAELQAQNESLKSALEAKIEALETQLNAKIAELEEQDRLFAEQLQDVANDLTALEAVVDANYDELVASIATLKANLEAKIAENKLAIANNAANIEANAINIAKVADDLAATKTDLANLTNSVANLEVMLVKNYEEFTNFKAIVQGQIAALQASVVLLQDSYNDIANNIIPALEQQIATNNQLIQNVVADLANNQAVFEQYRIATNNTLKLLMDAVKAIQVSLTAMGDDIDNLSAQLGQIAYDLNEAKANCEAQIEECYSYINTIAASLEQSIAAAKAEQATQIQILNAQMTAIQASIAQANAMLQQEIADRQYEDARISASLSDLSDKYNELDAKYAERCDELANSLSDLTQEFAEYQVMVQHALDAMLLQLQKEIAEALNSANGYTDEQIAMLDKKLEDNVLELNTRINNLDTELRALIDETKQALQTAIDEAKTELQNQIDAIAERVTATEGRLDTAEQVIQQNFETFLATVAEIRAELENINGRIDSAESSINTLRAEYEAKVAEIEQKIADAKSELTTLINNEIATLKDNLQSQINELLGRVQSIVFVPEYSDGKGTINYAMLGNSIVESRSTMVYQVYPAECAAVIAKAPTVEDAVAPLSFVLEGLKTRGAEAQFNIVDVEGGLDGRLYVTFEARNLGADFYAGAMEYGVSLVLDTETANLSTVFTNVVPAKTPDVIDVALVNDQVTEDYTIEYTDLEKVVEVLPEHDFQFTIGGEGSFTVADMLDKGYDINVTKYAPTFALTTHDGSTDRDVFENKVDDTDPYLNLVSVNLNEATKLAVGDFETVTYKYDVCGTELSASANVRVIKITREVNMENLDIVWSYEQDAKSDAGLEPTNSVDVLTIASSTLPADVTYENLLVKTPTITVKSGDVVVNNVAVKFVGTNDAPTIELQGFEWNKTYDITALYELDSIDVTISVKVNTVDRGREPIVINLGEVTWELTKAFTLESESVYADSLEPLYDALVAANVNTTMNADEFLEDIFATNPYIVDSNTANDTEYSATKMYINIEDGEISSVYDLVDFDYATVAVPEQLDYVKEVTLWYGQEVKFEKSVKFGMQPVELTLDTDSIDLVKDLEFKIPAGSLLGIYDLVTNVDKESLTAAEYLKAIFYINEMCKQNDLVNGENLEDTKLVVDPDDSEGAVATAIYYYGDFRVTPESVVYQSTYTTWYGQTIIVNKTVNVDWTTYNYADVEYYVYSHEGEYFSVPKPTYLNEPVESQSLYNAYVNIDMNAAFNVVDKDGDIIAFNDLESLGLTSKFSFVEAPASGVYFQDNTNLLFYQGRDASVRVRGNLVLTNSNGVETVLPTNFDAGQKYDGYYVMQTNIVGRLQSESLNITISKSAAKTYTYYLMNQLTLQDARGFELIKHGELVMDNDREVTWSNGSWMVGDDTNGFASGYNAATIYGINDPVYILSGIPESLRSVLTFEPATGKLVYNNNNALTETTTIELSVNVLVGHIWQQETTSFKVRLTITE